MNSPDFQDQKRRVETKTEPTPKAMPMGTFRINFILNQAQRWFDGLPPLGKLFIVLLGTFVVLSILNTVLRILSALVVVGVIAIAVYAGYQFFQTAEANQTPPSDPGQS
jgi:hypothetical protein